MKNKVITLLPFVIMPVWIPVYCILDNLFLVEIFGCGCVPEAQTNMLNIAFNANDLRLVVFSALTVALSVWSVFLTKRFRSKATKILYCAAVVVFNLVLALWVVKSFLWA